MLKTSQQFDTSYVLEAKGLVSRDLVRACITPNLSKSVNFKYQGSLIAAHYRNISSTQRNTVLADQKGNSICLTEHFLAASALLGVTGFDLEISAAELPFGDGSAELWMDYLKGAPGLTLVDFMMRKDLPEAFTVYDDVDESRYIEVVPADNFSVEYRLRIQQPRQIEQDYLWKLGDEVGRFAQARTFSNEEENKILGLDGWILGITQSGFSKELHYANELAAHKALDLVGDLMLSGYNPLTINMRIISNKGGHALNAKVAEKLAKFLD